MQLTNKLFIAACFSLAQVLLLWPAPQVEAAKVICLSNPNRWCYGQSVPCPLRCPGACQVNCNACSSNCNIARCNRPGAVCQDPRFVGGDGKVFYFHGKKDEDFCILSDPDLHINAHFIGKPKSTGLKRDFTWVQSLGILFGPHKLYIGARRVATWDGSIDQLELHLDGVPILLPFGDDEVWREPLTGLTIQRLAFTNDISVKVSKSFNLKVRVVPVSERDSKTHGYNITPEDCFAHLDMSFEFYGLSSRVAGVLGQTYAPGYTSRVNSTAAMPIMGGYKEYLSSDLMTPDCTVSKFGAPSSKFETDKFSFPAMNCGSDSNGFSCRRR